MPVKTTVVKSVREESVATFDPSGLLSIPCADLLGTSCSLNLFITGMDTLTFQVIPGAGPHPEFSEQDSFLYLFER